MRLRDLINLMAIASEIFGDAINEFKARGVKQIEVEHLRDCEKEVIVKDREDSELLWVHVRWGKCLESART